ncbi:hypothetical protein ACTJKN_02525 [Pedobacter sp. 22163]|uniref:hypothetical protein n=1 Tax=Pedobacter sp. 22163 TaxID=3453883 RepID=UPI003F864719
MSFRDPNIVNGDMILAKMLINSQIAMEAPFNIEASTLDVNEYSQKQLWLENMNIKESGAVNLFLGGVNSKSLAFGKLKMVALGNDQFKIKDNVFDWNIERDQYKNAIISNRNIGTAIGWWTTHFLPVSWVLGGDFNVSFSGSVKIKK